MNNFPLRSKRIISCKKLIKNKVIRLKDEGVDEKLALMIAQKVWCEFGSKDVRDVLKVGHLANNIQEAEYIAKIMKSYSDRQ